MQDKNKIVKANQKNELADYKFKAVSLPTSAIKLARVAKEVQLEQGSDNHLKQPL